jgi:hypothetical protein
VLYMDKHRKSRTGGSAVHADVDEPRHVGLVVHKAHRLGVLGVLQLRDLGFYQAADVLAGPRISYRWWLLLLCGRLIVLPHTGEPVPYEGESRIRRDKVPTLENSINSTLDV